MKKSIVIAALFTLVCAGAAQAGYEAVGKKTNCNGDGCGTIWSRKPKTIKQYWVEYDPNRPGVSAVYFVLDINNDVTPKTRSLIIVYEPWHPSDSHIVKELRDAFYAGKKLRWFSSSLRRAEASVQHGYVNTVYEVWGGEPVELILEP